MQTLEDKIKLLGDQLQKAIAKKQAIDEKQKNIDNRQKRKTETLKKILIGAAVLNKHATDDDNQKELQVKLKELLNKFLTRADHRALFDLEPLPDHPAKPLKTPKPPKVKTPKVKVEKSPEPTPELSSSS